MIDRRTFLNTVAGSLGGCLPLWARPRQRTPRTNIRKRGGVKKLVVLFQRGGNDGLNTLVPVDPVEYGHYRELRPTLGFMEGDLTALPNSSFFKMHPSLNPLLPMLNSGNLSFIHGVGYPSPDRSHFASQSFWETGIPGNGLTDGWLNRFLRNTSGQGLIRGVHVGLNIPQMASGSITFPVSKNFGNVNIEVDPEEGNNAEQEALRDQLKAFYDLPIPAGYGDLYEPGRRIFDMAASFSQRDLESYQPENGAVYPNTIFGSYVKHAAQMLKDDTFLGIEVVTLNQGGYDTHSAQANPQALTSLQTDHARLLNQLALSMAAFYQDMGPARMDDIVFLVISEFGRRAYENLSDGTDHGTGGLAMVMGNNVTGNHFGGDSDWPGLGSLYNNQDLGWTTDFRDIYWEILRNHLGVNSSSLDLIIPGHNYSPVGFYA